jgi:hypothetical protein
MEIKHHSLETRETNMVIKIASVIFGIACIGTACFWVYYNFSSVSSDRSLWVTVLFLSGFGIYLIWTGLGHGYRFIEIGMDRVRFRKNSFLKISDYQNVEISKIEFFPLKVIILLKNGDKNLIRFGVTDIEKIDAIKDDLMKFATDNDIETELINEV